MRGQNLFAFCCCTVADVMLGGADRAAMHLPLPDHSFNLSTRTHTPLNSSFTRHSIRCAPRTRGLLRRIFPSAVDLCEHGAGEVIFSKMAPGTHIRYARVRLHKMREAT